MGRGRCVPEYLLCVYRTCFQYREKMRVGNSPYWGSVHSRAGLRREPVPARTSTRMSRGRLIQPQNTWQPLQRYSDRRKLRISCFWDGDRALNLATTALASELQASFVAPESRFARQSP